MSKKEIKRDNIFTEIYWGSTIPFCDQKKLEAAMKAWNFDVRSISPGDLARLTAVTLLKKSVGQYLEISTPRLYSFCIEVERSYNQRVPYHNFKYGFMVMHVTGRLLSRMDKFNAARKPLNALHRTGLMLAALCHDISHDGKTNAFHINAKSTTMLKYSDTSTLEHMHVARTVARIKDSKLFTSMHYEKKRSLMRLMRILIMATDASLQKELIAKCSQLKLPIHRRGSWKKQDLFCKLLIHCSDISNPTMTRNLSQYWAGLVLEEFQLQIKEEELLGLTPSSFLRAETGSVAEAKLHGGFISHVVKPAWRALQNLMPKGSIDKYVATLSDNDFYWNDRRHVRIM